MRKKCGDWPATSPSRSALSSTSHLTLPLFGAQFALGLKLDEGARSEPVRATHAAIATTMVGLFTVNTVTGVWNLIEGRQNPNGKLRRLVLPWCSIVRCCARPLRQLTPGEPCWHNCAVHIASSRLPLRCW